MRDELIVLAFAGSTRAGSFNRALLRAAAELAPPGMRIETAAIEQLPFYDADVEAEGDPELVAEFKRRIWAADGVLIATPEYNDGIPGLLTNAIDWASRLPGRAPLTAKPVAIVGASASQVGTARAQLHLRTLLNHVQARPLPPPEVLVARAQEKFDVELRLVDRATRELLRTHLERFVDWMATTEGGARSAAAAGGWRPAAGSSGTG